MKVYLQRNKEITEQILEYLYRTWRFLSGKSARAYNAEDLSGRSAESG